MRTTNGAGIDIWVGSTGDKTIVGVVCTLDLEARHGTEGSLGVHP